MAGWVCAAAVAAAAVIGVGVLAVRRRGRAGAGPVSEPWPLRHSLVVFLVGAGALLGVFAVVYGATNGETTKDRVDVAIKAAAAVAAVAAGLLTWARLELSRHEHRLGIDRDLTERYGRAVDQLGSDDELIRWVACSPWSGSRSTLPAPTVPARSTGAWRWGCSPRSPARTAPR